ncbi:aminotransferase class V-fold PLP-dependent enzyme [Postechiella marina]|uniref:Aminotransferase class V-fold PLP-dependent enzyme n=1 Tax=Postechiella marina TaxID=943941 RepID=A0ABP8CBU8_9FLAO
MQNLKHLFDLPNHITYLNTATMSPLLKSTNLAGKKAIDKKSVPFTITSNDFFSPLNLLKKQFAKLINTNEPERIAAIPSASYGIATVANNIVLNAGDEILIVEDQFPSNFYAWQRLVEKYNAKIITIAKPKGKKNRGKNWNIDILNSITEKTAVIAIGHIHWADGTLFNLKAISKKAKTKNALLIVDATQSLGALPFSIKNIQPDAVICAGYKWLFGAYAYGLAYYGPYFDDGIPIEENWSNRVNSDNFADLTNYQSEYKIQAARYNSGENANFIAVAMLQDSISNILEWTPEYIQLYCQEISQHIIKPLTKLGCQIEDSEYRANHLFGIELPNNIDLTTLKAQLEKHRIFVSIRGNYIRVSCHLFNTKEDFTILLQCLTSIL